MPDPLQIRVREIFLTACELEAKPRADYLQQACAGDSALRREVESLLAHRSGDAAFLERPILGAMEIDRPADPKHAPAAPADTPAPLPERIGSYRVIQLLGQGGMGVVYLAEQERPRRRVALKMLRPAFATPSMLRRLEHEAEVLAMLRHPGIAAIYEAGTTDAGAGAQPYFAMELVRGPTLIEFARTRRLPLRERLALMAKVCDAVQHAHTRGVIHRDLKPGNILVEVPGEEETAAPAAQPQPKSGHGPRPDPAEALQPKILDFGIAKVTNADLQATTQTGVGQLLGTIPYMSPEQVTGDPLEVDFRSDIYALGVVLYELIAERPPYDLRERSIPDAVRIIRDEEPSRLGTISREFRGDVETVVAKALEKDKRRRYETAADLGADLRRYLADEPIDARPPSARYQLVKFSRRHKGLVAGIVGIILTLTAGTVVSTILAVRARNAAQAATAAQSTATSKAVGLDVLRRALSFAHPDAAQGHEWTVIEALDQAASSVGTDLRDQPEAEAEARTAIGSIYQAQGKFDAAEPHIRRAVELNTAIHGTEHAATATALENLASLRLEQDHLAEADALYQQVLDIRRRVKGEDDRETLLAWNNIALIRHRQSRFDEAEQIMRDTLASLRRVAGDRDPDTISLMNNLGNLLIQRGKPDAAEPLLRDVYDLRLATLGERSPDTLTSMNSYAKVLFDRGQIDRAARLWEECLTLRRLVLGNDHPNTLITFNNYTSALFRQNRLADAEVLFRDAHQACLGKLGADHIDTLLALNNLAFCLMRQERWADAEPLLKEASDRGPQSGNEMFAAIFRGNYGTCLMKLQQYDAAESNLTDAVATLEAVVGPEHGNTQQFIHALVDLYTAQGQTEKADEAHARLKQ